MTSQEIKIKNLLHGIELCGYMSGSGDKYLQDSVIVDPMTAFQEDGSNLTITFLSLNRVNLSIRLINSINSYIPNFKGKLLIVDNGSDLEQLNVLKKYINNLANLDIQIKELGKNVGVAGGRNKSVDLINTDWFMSLDNDVYFLKNPLPMIKEGIDKLGVHYINLPLLEKDGLTIFATGGNLWLAPYKDTYYIGGSGSFQQGLYTEFSISEPFLSTFLFGGASVIRTKSFIEQGCFDENMFIGFEDIDFSLKLYKKGIKIGNIVSFCAIHGHEVPNIQADINYEKIRFSQAKIKESGEYFFKKHNIHVWTDEVNNWIKTRELDLKLNKSDKSEKIEIPAANFYDSIFIIEPEINYYNNKPKVALVVDIQDWAFHNIAKQIVANLSDKYNFTIFIATKYENVAVLLLEAKKFHLIHFFWRDYIFNIICEYNRLYFQEKGWNYKEFLVEVLPKLNITSSVFDHLFLSEKQIIERELLFNVLLNGYTVSSQKLADIYDAIDDYHAPELVIEDGVDFQKFFPVNLERFSENNREIIVGWVGNSEWGPWQQDGKDYKGLKTLVKPAVEALRAEGFPVCGIYADRAEKWLPHDQMVNYYNSIDIYICASDIEGTPNPVLEAMACGVPIISTDVGIVPQVFGKLQSEFILPLRSLETLKNKLRLLLESPETRKRLSEENLERIQSWAWKAQCSKWDYFFQQMLSENASQLSSRNLLKKMVLEKHISCNVTLEQSEREKALLLEQSEREKALLLEQSEREKAILKTRIEAMESSKFWKFRKQWFKLKRKLGLTQEEP